MRGLWTLEFALQLAVSTAGAMVLGVLAGLIPSLLIAAIVKNASPGNFIDHVVDQPIFRISTDNAYFLGPVLAGFALAIFGARIWKTRAGVWVWVLPLIVLVYNLLTWASKSHWVDAWATYFGSPAECGGSECVNEVFLTAPFFTSFAYSLGCVARKLLPTSRPNQT